MSWIRPEIKLLLRSIYNKPELFNIESYFLSYAEQNAIKITANSRIFILGYCNIYIKDKMIPNLTKTEAIYIWYYRRKIHKRLINEISKKESITHTEFLKQEIKFLTDAKFSDKVNTLLNKKN